MGAIAGIIYPNLFPISYAVHPMLEVMAPRSPAESRVHQYRNVELGARGEEVAFDPSESVWMVLDGHIYNLPELHQELNHRGYNLREPMDRMQVLCEAYQCWGESFVERLNGPFALALFDREEHELILARSRLGRKPLFWSQHNNYFLFGSEIKSVLASGLVPQSPDVDAFTPYLFFGYLPGDYSLISGVNRLLPGSTLRLSRDGAVSIRSYWRYEELFLDQKEYEEREVSAELQRHLLRIAGERTESCDSVGYFSRGGIGAASLGYCLGEVCPRHPPTALTVTLQGEEGRPLDRAERIADRFGERIVTKELSPDELFDDLVKLVWHLDDPIGDPETVFTWHLFELASRHSKVVYSPAGCNEILAGHARYAVTEHRLTMMRYMAQLPRRLLHRVVLPMLKWTHRGTAYNILRHLEVDPWQIEYLEQSALFSSGEIPAVAPRLPAYFNPVLFLQRFPELHHLGSTISAFLFLDGKTVLPDRLIPQYDRFAPVHGVRCITPFLDRFLIQFMAGVPDQFKLFEGEVCRPLQNMLKGPLPNISFNEPKPLFSLPPLWMNHPLVREVFELVSRGSLAESGWISGSWIRQALSRREMTSHLFKQLWSLLILEIWFRLFVFDPIPHSPPEVSLLEYLRSD